MILWFQRLFYQLKGYLKKQPISESLLNLWKTNSFPKSTSWKSIDYLVVDTETTGLNANEHSLISIGWIVISGGKVKLNSAKHIYIKSQDNVGDSATIHHIRDCQLEDGVCVQQAIEELLEISNHKALVFHHAPMDLSFLNKYIEPVHGAPLLTPTLDTLKIERIRNRNNPNAQSKGFYKLANCRERYGLSPHQGHNALTDAIATAELLLAQIAYKGKKVKFGELVR